MQDTSVYLKAAALSWERLRLAYNAVLLVEGLCLSWGLWVHVGGPLRYAWMVIVFGLTANAFYSLGPLAETYACVVFGRRLARYRYALFAVGLLFSAGVVVFLALSTQAFVHQVLPQQ